MATAKANLKTDQYVRINTGFNPMILQSNMNQVRIALSDVKPAKDNTAFHQLDGGDIPFFLRSIDTNVWAFAVTDNSSLTVTEFTGQEGVDNPIDTIVEFATLFMGMLSLVTSNQDIIIRQLQMMNLRLEEAFETDLDEVYLDDPSD